MWRNFVTIFVYFEEYLKLNKSYIFSIVDHYGLYCRNNIKDYLDFIFLRYIPHLNKLLHTRLSKRKIYRNDRQCWQHTISGRARKNP